MSLLSFIVKKIRKFLVYFFLLYEYTCCIGFNYLIKILVFFSYYYIDFRFFLQLCCIEIARAALFTIVARKVHTSERLELNKMETPKRRGRPKGSKTKKINAQPASEIDTLVASMNEQMDMQKKWIFEDISTEAKLEHRRRTAIEDAVKRGDIDEKAWEEEQEIIEKLWLQIKELKENETKMMEQECREVEETTDATVYDSEDNEEEDAKVAENEAIHATRAPYLKWKPPITSFNEYAFLELPEDKQHILLEHNDEIFGKNVLYQEQIEKVVLLIYDPTRGSCLGCKNIADLLRLKRV